MWRGSRHIILVERASAHHGLIIYGISCGGWRRDVTAQTLLGGGLQSHMAAHTQLVRADRMLYRMHQRRIALGAACIAHASGRQHRARARRSRHADGQPRQAAPAHAQHSPLLLVAPAGWPTRVRQHHPFHSHRLSTARTDHHPRAVVTAGWRWRHLIGDVLHQPQLAAQTC